MAAASSASAAFVLDLPAGLACPGFDLRVEGGDSPHRVSREFMDRNGNPVRLLTAGRGIPLTLTNLNTGASISLRPNGSVEHVRLNPDGTSESRTTGHNVLIMFPTDVPAGPSTRLFVGLNTFTIDANGVFTIVKTAGKVTDLCAALG